MKIHRVDHMAIHEGREEIEIVAPHGLRFTMDDGTVYQITEERSGSLEVRKASATHGHSVQLAIQPVVANVVVIA